MSFICLRIKNYFHINHNGFALSLALKQSWGQLGKAKLTTKTLNNRQLQI